jgi:hypothetical protein
MPPAPSGGHFPDSHRRLIRRLIRRLMVAGIKRRISLRMGLL